MSAHFEHNLDDLKQKLLTMASKASAAVNTVIKALVNRDDDLARQVKEADNDLDELEVAGDFHAHGDETQFGGQRRFGKEVDAGVVDFDLVAIENGVVLFDLAGQVVVAVDQGLDGAAHSVFGMAGHVEEASLELLLFLLEVHGHRQGGLRVAGWTTFSRSGR